MSTFTIDGVLYNAKEFTYNYMCDLEERGVDIGEIDKKPMSISRDYFAYCAGISIAEAGDRIESHLIGGGDLEEFFRAMTDAMENSGFFQATRQNQKEAKKARNKKEQS